MLRCYQVPAAAVVESIYQAAGPHHQQEMMMTYSHATWFFADREDCYVNTHTVYVIIEASSQNATTTGLSISKVKVWWSNG